MYPEISSACKNGTGGHNSYTNIVENTPSLRDNGLCRHQLGLDERQVGSNDIYPLPHTLVGWMDIQSLASRFGGHLPGEYSEQNCLTC